MKYKILTSAFSDNFVYNGIDTEHDAYICNSDNCGCRDGTDYCRGSRYEGLRVCNVELHIILSHLLEINLINSQSEDIKNCEFVDYCVDRLLRIYKVYDKNNWIIDTSNGYYGEEIDSIKFYKSKELIADIIHIIRSDPHDRILYILNKEYGYLLPGLEHLNWEEQLIPFKTIKNTGNVEYKKLVNIDNYALCNSSPIGVYTFKDNVYKLVDGHHRLRTLNIILKDTDVVRIIVGKLKIEY